ncbi:MAG: flavodoxin family protein [Candidatus Bathyarchaeota archaeon]|nr:flavodoxin family protein [Candidatus Bathyarchaeota archaeon]
MKILAFNASPRKSHGITEIIMKKFLEGAEDTGAEIESHYVVDLDINGCTGCFSCWWKTPGKCIHRDDMDWILPKMTEYDVVYLGTPIFHYNIIHYLQRMRERTLPLSMPEMYISEDETHHTGRHKKQVHTVLAAVCGFPDQINFNQAKGLFPSATHIMLPYAQILMYQGGERFVPGFLDSVKKAGYELAKKRKLTEEHRAKLVVEYSDDVKKEMVEWHNEMSKRM